MHPLALFQFKFLKHLFYLWFQPKKNSYILFVSLIGCGCVARFALTKIIRTNRDHRTELIYWKFLQHDDVLERKGPHGNNWQTNPFPVARKVPSTKSEKYASLAEHKFVPKLYQFQSEDEEGEHYERLCRGEKLRVSLRFNDVRVTVTLMELW